MKLNTRDILKDIPSDITVVAATKYFKPHEMRLLYTTGIQHFGENRMSALLEKQAALKELDITWHFIGTLQTKKVKKMIGKIDYLHSLHKLKLAKEINKRRSTPLKCFMQVNISDETSKHGFKVADAIPALEAMTKLPNVDIIGLMGMATHTDDEALIHRQFQQLNTLQKEIKSQLDIDLKELSIGMSNDYLIALKHNATYLRLGSVLFDKEA
ncbi:MAG: YggS family pyridoxal phosphate-dependent enzyme [Candidatus Izimaplasma sp.]|nr:YggS family pyridoxal phosphate-dependent enzyme [Candidatus Izimaplasma bacterium]